MAIAYVIPVWGDSNNSSSDSTVSSKPIIIHKTKDVPVKLAPSKGLEAVMIFDVVKVTFRFPFDFWPAYVEISGEGSTYGYWSWTLADSSCSMPFDGESGDYCLKVSTPEGTYIGYFSLD